MSHPIPPGALAQHIAVLGKTGSGKTYAVRGAVERLLDAGERVCVIDPTGAWHGLRSSADGKRPGFPVVIFGGDHADFPLGPRHGDELAEIVGTSSTPAIIDTSLLRVSERTVFFRDFADALMRRNRGPLHLVIDEAHVFLPQGKVPSPQAGEMLAAGNNMVSGGRSRGLRITLITQRPAKLHKDSLTQVETLIAMRLIAPQDRAAVDAWIKDNADEARARDILSSLATLKTGHGWIWAPELGLLERVQFPKIRTFDSSRAPDSADAKSVVLAPIDREAVAARLRTVAAEASANDPAALRKEIARLKAERGGASRADVQAAEQRGYQRGLTEGRRALEQDRRRLHGAVHEAVTAAFKGASAPPAPAPAPVRAAPPRRQPTPVPRPRATNGSGEPVPKGEAAVLAACIQFPDGLRREQLTVLTGYKRSTRDAYIQRLRERGYVDVAGDRVVATDNGVAALPDAEPLPTGEALQDYWFQRLPEGERAILRVLVERYPAAVPRDDLTEETTYKRSTRDAYLQRLSAKELIAEPARGEVRASEALFQ